MSDGRSINKLQNGIILLIFSMKIPKYIVCRAFYSEYEL